MSPSANGSGGDLDLALDVRDLSVALMSGGDKIRILDRISLSVHMGESVGLVGESGSGKSLTSLAVIGLLPRNVVIDGGAIDLFGEDLTTKPPRALRQLRGKKMSMVLQDPMSSLDPSFTIGDQMGEALRRHKGLKGPEMAKEAVRLLKRLRISRPEEVLGEYPHQLSGGMLQRVCSAIALSGEPDLLIADEPTTALDVTTQALYLDLLRELQETTGFALILISHDLAVVQEACDRLVVMYAGQVVEEGRLDAVISAPAHPYTRALLDAVPSLSRNELRPIEGQLPDLRYFSTDACRFADRCGFARPVCRSEMPELTSRGADRMARCFGTEADGWIEPLSMTDRR